MLNNSPMVVLYRYMNQKQVLCKSANVGFRALGVTGRFWIQDIILLTHLMSFTSINPKPEEGKIMRKNSIRTEVSKRGTTGHSN